MTNRIIPMRVNDSLAGSSVVNYQASISRLNESRFDHFPNAFIYLGVGEAPDELLDAAAADAFGSDIQRRGRGTEAVEVRHLVVAGDEFDVAGQVSASAADRDAGGGECRVDGWCVA